MNAELQRKELALNALLELTQAINSNLPEEQLYRIYNFTLRGNLSISKMALFVLDDDHWNYKTGFGVALNWPKPPIDLELLANIRQITSLASLRVSASIKEFDTLVPVFHKNKILAYVLISENYPQNIETSFIQTLTNVLIVAIENKKLSRQQLEQEVLKKELDIARKVQFMLLPKFLPFNEKLQVKTYYNPHSKIGGDYYDYINISDNKFFICIADVSGKGIGASLMMANFQASLRTIVRQTQNLKKIVEELNFLVHANAQGENFITFFGAIYDQDQKILSYVNAGHNPPFLCQPKQPTIRLDQGATVLGVFSPLPFIHEVEISGVMEFLMFAYTDGLVEAINPQDEQFGENRILEIIEKNYNQNLDILHEFLIKQLDEFRQGISLPDDITLLSCKVME